MKKINLLKWGFLFLFCTLGTFAWADALLSVNLPYEDVVSCTFYSSSGSKAPTDTEHFTFTSGSYSNSNSYGPVEIDGVSYSIYDKLTSSGSISFTTTEENTVITIVFSPSTVNESSGTSTTIAINGTTVDVSANPFTYNCESVGEYVITAEKDRYIFYIGATKALASATSDGDDSTGGDDTETGGDGNDDNSSTSEGTTVSDDIQCWFTDGSPTNSYFTFTSCNYSTSKGTAVINGETIKNCLKLETDTQVSFTTSNAGAVLTLVFADTETTPNVYLYKGSIDDSNKTTLSETASNVITYTLGDADTYYLKKDGSYNIFYIGITGDTTTGGDDTTTDPDDSGNTDDNSDTDDQTETSSTIEVSDANYCTFAASNAINQTGDITFDLSSNDGSTVTGTGHGTITIINGETSKDYDTCLKLNSHPTVSFTTTEEMVMTLVFETNGNLNSSSHTDRCITVDGATQSITDGNVMQITLQAGDHTLARVSSTEHYLFYIGLSATSNGDGGDDQNQGDDTPITVTLTSDAPTEELSSLESGYEISFIATNVPEGATVNLSIYQIVSEEDSTSVYTSETLTSEDGTYTCTLNEQINLDAATYIVYVTITTGEGEESETTTYPLLTITGDGKYPSDVTFDSADPATGKSIYTNQNEITLTFDGDVKITSATVTTGDNTDSQISYSNSEDSETASTTWTLTIPDNYMTAGSITITVNAEDADGHPVYVGESQDITLTYTIIEVSASLENTTEESLADLKILKGSNYGDNQFTLTVTAEGVPDGGGVTILLYQTDSEGNVNDLGGDITAGENNTYTWSCETTIQLLSGYTYEFKVFAYYVDESENHVAVGDTITIATIEGSFGTSDVTFTATPASGSTINANQKAITLTFTSNAIVTSAQMSTGDDEYEDVIFSNGSKDNTTDAETWTLSLTDAQIAKAVSADTLILVINAQDTDEQPICDTLSYKVEEASIALVSPDASELATLKMLKDSSYDDQFILTVSAEFVPENGGLTFELYTIDSEGNEEPTGVGGDMTASVDEDITYYTWSCDTTTKLLKGYDYEFKVFAYYIDEDNENAHVAVSDTVLIATVTGSFGTSPITYTVDPEAGDDATVEPSQRDFTLTFTGDVSIISAQMCTTDDSYENVSCEKSDEEDEDYTYTLSITDDQMDYVLENMDSVLTFVIYAQDSDEQPICDTDSDCIILSYKVQEIIIVPDTFTISITPDPADTTFAADTIATITIECDDAIKLTASIDM
ncbi:MAG: copper resistance protein CopC, partial [Clostridia bacterium]|nr:copper resistance protein CopC [Clostridia bacterium]